MGAELWSGRARSPMEPRICHSFPFNIIKRELPSGSHVPLTHYKWRFEKVPNPDSYLKVL